MAWDPSIRIILDSLQIQISKALLAGDIALARELQIKFETLLVGG